MTSVASLYEPVADDIPMVGDRLRTIAQGQHPLLGEALNYVFRSSGKQIRPALVLLSGKLGGYARDRLVTLAASLEVVHTATLVHDDTIDEALSRRGLTTINAVWDGKVAILVGDFLFAQSAYLAAQLDSVRIMTLLSDTVMEMSSGELRQYASARGRTLDEADYLKRIAGKTASLFAMCCEGAAIVSGQSEQKIEALRAYGHNLGMAFQIADDVLDVVGTEVQLGKPAGSDLRQGVVTLPVILFARGLSTDSPLQPLVLDAAHVDEIVRAVARSDAPDSALNRARAYAEAARGALHVFPCSEAREALEHLAGHVVERHR
jgi:geranylgeranyl pyrophosphate synthase